VTDLVHVKGLKELTALLQSVPAKLEKNVLTGALRAGAKVVQIEAKANVPVATGTLRDGLKVSARTRNGTVTAKVKATGKHAHIAHWLEYGVAAHQITAKSGGWLFFGGLFAKSIDHPGFQPRAWLRPALDSQATPAVVAAAEYMKKRLATRHGIDTADIEIEAL
jgi:HK97 gp10 family phage protein